jgi:hypothetical protein
MKRKKVEKQEKRKRKLNNQFNVKIIPNLLIIQIQGLYAGVTAKSLSAKIASNPSTSFFIVMLKLAWVITGKLTR